MNSPKSDDELGKVFRRRAAALGYSPEAFMDLAEAAAHRRARSVMPDSPPFPRIEREEEIGPEQLAAWPEWSATLIPPGCRIQKMTWPDGTVTTRLMSPRELVLAAKIEHPSDPR